MTTQSSTQINGIDTQILAQTAQAIRQDPEMGKARFRVRNHWIEGARNCTHVSNFFAARQEQTHQNSFELQADEPPMLAGQDQAPNPVEHLLNALAGCVTTSLIAHAAVRGIALQSVESELEGDIDLRGFFGLANVPRGFSNIRVKFNVNAPGATPEQLRQLVEFSPVFNTITHGCRIDLAIANQA